MNEFNVLDHGWRWFNSDFTKATAWIELWLNCRRS